MKGFSMREITKMMRDLVLLCLLMSLSACGFHLRGNTPLIDGAQTVHVFGLKGSFTDKLNDALISSGAQVVKSQTGADLLVSINEAQSSRSIGTLNERGRI
ncbi:MAG: hypothetical protein KTR16_01255, partial [Acidiferrobacterales bacterium]|nr:hypothetical protein [Acidiferrobacterales bacterium]